MVVYLYKILNSYETTSLLNKFLNFKVIEKNENCKTYSNI